MYLLRFWLPRILLTAAFTFAFFSSCKIKTPAIDRLKVSIDDFNIIMETQSKQWQDLIDSLSSDWENHTEEQIRKLLEESDEYQVILREYNGTLQDFLTEIRAFRAELPLLVSQIELIISNQIGSASSSILCISEVIQESMLQKLEMISQQLVFGDASTLSEEELKSIVNCHVNMTKIRMKDSLRLREQLIYTLPGVDTESFKRICFVLERSSFDLELSKWRIDLLQKNRVALNLASPENGVPFDDLLNSSIKVQLYIDGEPSGYGVPIIK